jgi:hypothetical protein
MHLILGDPTLRQLDLNYTDSQRGVLTPFRSSRSFAEPLLAGLS